MVNGSKCLLLFPWCGVSRVISDHVTDCYFCMTNIRAFSGKNKSKISYPVCKSAIKPIPHDPDLPEPQPPTEKEDTLSVDERASTGTESEEDLIESDPSFQHESAVLHHSSSIRNA